MASMIVVLSLPFRFQQQFGFSAAEAGAMLAAWPLAMMVGAPVSGILSDRVPAGILGAIGMTVATAALTALAFLPAAPSHFDIVWRVGLSGLGFSMFFSPNARQIVGSAPAGRVAAAGGLVSTNRMAGQTLGATGAAALLASGNGIGPAPFLIGAGLAFVAGMSSLIVLRPKLRRPTLEDIPDL
jgi:DHA2 family multidrug resistance protein-like MFS transporter